MLGVPCCVQEQVGVESLQSRAARHHQTMVQVPYCKHEGTTTLDVFHKHIQRMHPEQYESTTMNRLRQ